MALDRQEVERRDFPITRRGYDPEAVDAHLRALADTIERLERDSRREREAGSIAEAASRQVRRIVGAAEAAAAKLREEAERELAEARDRAEREAAQVLREAREEAERTRAHAASQAGESVAKLAVSADALLERIEASARELDSLVEAVRPAVAGLRDELEWVREELGAVAAGEAAMRPERGGAERREAETEAAETEAAEVEAAEVEAAEVEAAEVEAAGGERRGREAATEEPQAPAEAGAPTEEEAEAARLVALNMALNGSSREEIASHLTENFSLADQEALLDEVFAAVEG